MTDHTASTSAPGPQDQPCPDQASGTPATGSTQPSQPWEVITFPGQIAVTDTSTVAPEASLSPEASAPHRTEELIQLIQDLNQCNDALLIRVSDLEESLERSQAALQAEIDRHEAQGTAGADRAVMPPQIAQLLSELDVANDGLRRASIHNETLQTELESSQQRVAQLERECTLLQQRFSEKTTALQQAEDTCRDLKARLHRQQRYTLQFKTALEKCLKANDGPSSMAMAGGTPGLGLTEDPSMAMPKAQKIQPWSAPNLEVDQAAGLSTLIHSLKAPVPSAASRPSQAPSDAANPSTNPSMPPAAFTPFPPGTDRAMEGAIQEILEAIGQKPAPATDPSPSPGTNPSPSFEDAVAEMAADAARPTEDQTFSSVADPWQPPADEPSPGFTEPSPWGNPLVAAAAQPEAPAPQSPAPQPPAPHPDNLRPDDLPGVAVQPAWAAPIQASPPQPPRSSDPPATTPPAAPRKLQSLAAVQLPSFGRPPQRRSS
ncbi:MAG: hypothetical protein VKI82_02015 [Leptolyngbya sp.]|nr:hypothetical protein [Leptolyngbya sp.]